MKKFEDFKVDKGGPKTNMGDSNCVRLWALGPATPRRRTLGPIAGMGSVLAALLLGPAGRSRCEGDPQCPV